MELRIALIRSGRTQGDLEGRYIAQMDEGLLGDQAQYIKKRVQDGIYPAAEVVYASDLSRSIGTAQLIYPCTPVIALKELRPLDMGRYTGLQYHQITQDKQFLWWAAQPRLLPLDDGEPPYFFYARCARALRMIAEEMASKGLESAAVVSHRGVMECILRRYQMPRNYYGSWQIPHGGGCAIRFDTVYKISRMDKSF